MVKVGEAAGMGEGVEWEWSICVWAVGGGTARGGAVEWRGNGHLHAVFCRSMNVCNIQGTCTGKLSHEHR